ncbi:hypothetical protein [Pseudomonas sp.]|uniref:hypothetical protein n=1 Tax=Pseudomonas sp. TaxID=306 RepID=UPI003A98075F
MTNILTDREWMADQQTGAGTEWFGPCRPKAKGEQQAGLMESSIRARLMRKNLPNQQTPLTEDQQ